MDGKVVSTPQRSCTDRIAHATFRQEGVEPKEYLNQALDVISSNFESGKIDAGFLVMARELLDERPDVAEAWMKAELDAQRYLADPANAGEIAAQTGGMR